MRSIQNASQRLIASLRGEILFLKEFLHESGARLESQKKPYPKLSAADEEDMQKLS